MQTSVEQNNYEISNPLTLGQNFSNPFNLKKNVRFILLNENIWL